MKILVMYKSKTGFTKKYAQMIAEELEATLVDIKEATAEKISSYDVCVYGGGLYAGMVNGLKQAKEMFVKSGAKRLVVFATGATPNEAAESVLDEMWKNNFSPEELESIAHFYMQSGICYEKMGVMDKMMMKMMSKVLSKKTDMNDYDEAMAQAIARSYDISDKKYIEPVIEYLKEMKK